MNFRDKIRVIDDFPIQGISFKDITTVLQDGDALRAAIDEMYELIDFDVDFVVGPEARGFLFAPTLAYKLGVGFIPIRKPGKLPYETESYTYELEYGTDTLEIHNEAIKKGDKILIIDDLLATGGTLLACAKLVEKLRGEVSGIFTFIELEIGGREKLKGYNVKSLVSYDK